ncbi:MAG TPA: hypothetical protein DGH68_05070 [Bacteroidetes bacterium]|nr:hypothetical protein [Bacteroidota bacterium]
MRGAMRVLIEPRKIVLAVSIVAFVLSCKDENPQGPDIVFPSSNVSYSQHVQPLFNQACTFAGCHDDGQHQSPLKLTSWANTVMMVPGIVVSGRPDQSILVSKIQGSLGQRMPPNTNPLNQNQINGIRTWIADSAKNN